MFLSFLSQPFMSSSLFSSVLLCWCFRGNNSAEYYSLDSKTRDRHLYKWWKKTRQFCTLERKESFREERNMFDDRQFCPLVREESLTQQERDFMSEAQEKHHWTSDEEEDRQFRHSSQEEDSAKASSCLDSPSFALHCILSFPFLIPLSLWSVTHNSWL